MSKYTLSHIRVNDINELKSECGNVGLLTVDGALITSSHNHHLMVIGDLYEESGVLLTDKDGNKYKEKVKIEGFHANLKYKEDVGLNHLSISVKTPLVS